MSSARSLDLPPGSQCLADTVLMVRPAAFGPNPETAASNRFQSIVDAEPRSARLALAEFESLANALSSEGVEVICVADTPLPVKPDAVFPNNWLTTHRDGKVVLYPMLAPSRRAERRPELLSSLTATQGRRLTAVVDLSPWEPQGRALEGTGSLVLDRRHRIAYAALSPRTCQGPLGQWASLLNYKVEAFTASDADGVPVYHTNVMMSLGENFAVVALSSIAEPAERERVRASLETGGRELIEISREQMAGFGANLLQLATSSGPVIALSRAARETLGPGLVAQLERHGRIISVAIPTIERYGGGSVRCMLAEVFLPKSAR